MRPTRAHLSRPESLAEAARGAFEGPKSTEEAPFGVRASARVDFVPIWGRFLGVRSVWRIGRGGSRSTFVEIRFFRLRERLGLDFAPPRPASGGSLTRVGRSLGAPGRSMSAPVGPKEAFRSSSGAVLGTSWGTLRCSGAPFGPGRFGARFEIDFGLTFGRFRSIWGGFLVAVCARLSSVYAPTFLSIACWR